MEFGPFIGVPNGSLLMIYNPANGRQVLQFSGSGSPQWVNLTTTVSAGGSLADTSCLLSLTVDSTGRAYATAPNLISAAQQYLYEIFPSGTTAIVGTSNVQASVMTVGGSIVDAHAAAIFDGANGVEASWTFRQVMRAIAAVLVGKSSSGGSTFRDLNDTKNRVVATVDDSSNRTAISTDLT